MSPARSWLAWIRDAVRSRAIDRDMREQISAHIDEATEEYVLQGLSREEARRAALLDFGGINRTEEACRDARGRWLHDLGKDIGYGLRTLRRSPGFAAVSIASLAVGIGANTAVFSVVNAMLFKPRAVSNPEEIAELYIGEPNRPYDTCSYPSYLEFRERNAVFTDLAAYGTWQFRVGDANTVEQVWGEVVSGNYFDVLGVRPAFGRTFLPAEDVTSAAHPVVVIADSLWRRRFNGDPGVVGQTLHINGQPVMVIGVAPPQYTGYLRGLSTEMWVPVTSLPALEPGRGDARLTSRGSRWAVLIGRMKPGVTVQQVRAQFDVLGRDMRARHPEEWASTEYASGVRELFVSVVRERDSRVHPGGRTEAYALAALLLVVVNLVLLMGYLNLASMLLARAVVRRKETAVRLALGASRGRIIRQLTTESLLLSVIAGAVGGVLAVWLIGTLVAVMPAFPEGIRVAIDVGVDWRVLAYTLAVAIVTGVLFGLAPALHSARTEVSSTLKDDAHALAGGYRSSRVRGMLIVAQVAVSVLLLIGAGLVLRSLEKVRPTRLGFESETVVLAWLSLDEPRYDRRKSQDFYRRVSERIASLPGVESVSLIDGIPGGFMGRSRRGTRIEGYPQGAGESLEVDANYVGPRYFTNMGVPIVEGRDFDERDTDGGPCVAIVNEAFVRRYFPATAPIGKRLSKHEWDGRQAHWRECEVVGIIRDDRWQSLVSETRPFYSMPVLQSFSRRMAVLAGTSGDPAAQVQAIRRAILDVDPRLPVDVQTVRQFYSAMSYPFQLVGLVMAGCGVMALLLASIGVYGVVAYSVAQRTREVGIRVVLGALRREILQMIVRDGMTLVAIGLILGLILSLGLTRLLTSSVFDMGLLFGVTATDSLTFASVTLLLSLVALVACCIPALRATKVDPIEALRSE